VVHLTKVSHGKQVTIRCEFNQTIGTKDQKVLI
jgi:hypothetical protein